MKDIRDGKEIYPAPDAKTDPFGENVSGEHAYVRTERLVNALYLLTNHVRHDDPLRLRIRSIGHELLSDVLALHGGLRAVSEARLAGLLALIREGISLTRLLHLAGYVSAQNVQILTQALDDLGQFLALSQKSALSDGIQLERSDFIPAGKLPLPTGYRGTQEKVQESTPISKERAAEDFSARRVPGRAVQTEVHSERRKMILHILGKGGDLGIKDIASQMVGCSEKTVQREIAALVQERLVKKQGEKRWSSYSLANV